MNAPEIEWCLPSRPIAIDDKEVHIWRIDLSDFLNEKQALHSLLSPDERQRAEKYRFEKDRDRYVIRRGILRKILGSYLKRNDEQLRFTYNRNGKQFLDIETGERTISYNTSFSADIAVAAVAFKGKVGIDVEFVDHEFPKFDVADRYFSVDEVSAIRSLPADLQTAAFFNCWTLKEAYVKALGEGLSRQMPKLKISTDIEDSKTIQISADPKVTKGWFISSFIPKPSYIAAVAYEGMPKTVRYLKWTVS